MDDPTPVAEDGMTYIGDDHDKDHTRLVTSMYEKLPQELVDLVEYWLYETAFCPGIVRPCANKAEKDASRPLLVYLSKRHQAEYSKRFWSENTFVFGAGATLFNNHIGSPRDASSNIEWRKSNSNSRRIARSAIQKNRMLVEGCHPYEISHNDVTCSIWRDDRLPTA
ncbi:MAG: hypothetical protein Q9166_000289 [cf. Caloplaca sp. 2 TL-2023]